MQVWVSPTWRAEQAWTSAAQTRKRSCGLSLLVLEELRNILLVDQDEVFFCGE